MSKPVFVLLTSKTCNGCIIFKRGWEVLKNEILARDQVRVIEIELPNNKSDIPSEHPTDLRMKLSINRWLPMCMFFNGDSWNRALQIKTARLDGAVLDGKMLLNSFQQNPEADRIPRPIDVINFIEENLTTHGSKVNDQEINETPILTLLTEGTQSMTQRISNNTTPKQTNSSPKTQESPARGFSTTSPPLTSPPLTSPQGSQGSKIQTRSCRIRIISKN